MEYDLRGKAYKDLPDKLKEDFDNCPVDVVKHLDCTDEEVGRHIIRYNSGRPMAPAQKISAYMYNTAKYVKKLSGHAFFSDCANYSDTADRNGTVDKVVSEAVMGLNFFDNWNKDAKKIGRYLNDNATEEMFDRLGTYLDRLLEVATPETGKLFSQKNALILFMLFDRFAKHGLSDDEFQLFLEHYDEMKKIKVEVAHEYELVKGSEEYTRVLSFAELNGCKSTKDKGIIEDKLHILETVMNDFLHIEEKETDDVINVSNNEESAVEGFISENVGLALENVKEDMECYEETLSDLENNRIRDSSKLLEESNHLSLLAMVAYSYKNDVDLDEWIEEYAENNNMYLIDQAKNFLHMVENFKQYQSRMAVA